MIELIPSIVIEGGVALRGSSAARIYAISEKADQPISFKARYLTQ